jgi:hypothetical protein
MDCTSTAAPAGSILHCALELSKNTWLLGIQFPDRPQPYIRSEVEYRRSVGEAYRGP